MTLSEQLDLWTKITGVNPSEEQRSYTIYMNGKLSDYDISLMNNDIKSALEFDESGLFAQAYLSVYLKKFLDEKSVSLWELIDNKELNGYVSDIKRLRESLNRVGAEGTIMEETTKAMAFYNIPCNLDVLTVANVRKCAEKNMKKLKLSQYSAGANRAAKFGLARNIYMFDSLDALVQSAVSDAFDGITLGYVRNQNEPENSFFGFIIKNGNNIYTLSDMPVQVHPAQKPRCPGRAMSRRIENNLFPYETVAGIKVEDLWDASRYKVQESEVYAVSKTVGKQYSVIGTIESLSETEILWLIIMADLIKKKFYDNKNIPKLELSYTKSMITSPHIGKNKNELIPKRMLPTLELNDVSITDTENLSYDKDYDEQEYCMGYLTERYEVDQSLLNVVSNTDQSRMLEDTYSKRFWDGTKGCDYIFLDLDTTSGTRKEIEYKQKWIARYNYATAVTKAAEKDYEENHSLLQAEIEKYIKPRIEELLIRHLQGRLFGKDTIHDISYESKCETAVSQIGKTWRYDVWKDKNGFSRQGTNTYLYGYDWDKREYKCYFTGKTAGVAVTIDPRNAEELSLVCGIPVEELPERLQHFDRKAKNYYGNTGLSNVDPLLWRLEDAFNKMTFGITVILSKSTYLNLCKKAGIEADRFWENEKPACYDELLNKSCAGKSKYSSAEGRLVTPKKCRECKWYRGNA